MILSAELSMSPQEFVKRLLRGYLPEMMSDSMGPKVGG